MSRRTISGQAAGVSAAAVGPRLGVRSSVLRGRASVRFDPGRAGRSRTRLGPGERMIDGRVYYSAAWLGRPPAIDAARPVVKQQRRAGPLSTRAWSPLCLLRAELRPDLEQVE